MIWEKPEAAGHQIWSLAPRFESPGWFDVLPQNSALDVMHEQVPCCKEASSHQLPIATSFWMIWIVFREESPRLMQNWMQICCSTFLVILNAMATVHRLSQRHLPPHWLVQWSRHCSRMHIPVHSRWLPGYISVMQTILVVLTMTGLFPDRPCMYTHT